MDPTTGDQPDATESDPSYTSIPDMDVYNEPEPVEEVPEDEDDSEDAPAEETAAAAPEKPAAPPEPEPLPAHVKAAMDDVLRRERELVESRHQSRAAAEQAERYRQVTELAKTDPIRALRELGGDTATALEKALGIEQEPDELERSPVVKKLYERIAQLEEGTKKQSETARQAQIADAQRSLYKGYSEVATNAGEDSILTAFADKLAPDTMYALAEQYAQNTGKWPADADVRKHAEQLLLSDAEKLLERLAKTPQFRGRFVSNGDSQTQAAGQTTPNPGNTKTLRNKDTAETPRRTKAKSLLNADPADVEAAGMAAFMAAAERGK